MKVYKYGMRMRGFSIGCQPGGVILHEDTNKTETGYWSYIYYNKPLTNEQIERYELDLIAELGTEE